MPDTETKHLDLVEHLAELRTRLIRSVVYLAVGAAVCWLFYRDIFAFLTHPMIKTLKAMKIDTGFQMTGLMEGFMLQLKVCVIAGVIVTAPLLTMEIWGFVSPGLTKEEKKPLRWIAPLSVILFVMGVTLCYLTLPVAIRWFVSLVPPNTDFRPFLGQNLLLMVSMLAAFGIAFEMPIALMFLGKLGIINSKMMKSYWRQAIVVTALMAAVITPSADAFTMLALAIPMAALYLLSIYLVKIVESKDDI